MKELIESVSVNLCQKRFIANYKKQVQIGDETINICSPNNSPNITMTSSGKVTIKLTDAIVLPSEFGKLFKLKNIAIYDVFRFKVGQNKLKWKPLEYFVQEELKKHNNNILNHAVTETYKVKILKVQLLLKQPWMIQSTDNLVVEICSLRIQ